MDTQTHPETLITERWHDHTCTRCRAELTAGVDTFQLRADRYEPMQPGPDWEAVGDWQPAPSQTVCGTLCSSCIAAVRDFAMAHAFGRTS